MFVFKRATFRENDCSFNSFLQKSLLKEKIKKKTKINRKNSD